MGQFSEYPYVNYADKNLDYILEKVGTVEESADAAASYAAAALISKTEAAASAVSASNDAASALASKNNAAISAASALESKDTAVASASSALSSKNTAAAAQQSAINAANLAQAEADTLGTYTTTYNSGQTYSVGDIVKYSSDIYQCITAITTPEAWDASKWSKVSVGNEIKNINNNLNTLNEYINTITSIPVDLSIKNVGCLYLHETNSEYPVAGYSSLNPITIPFDCKIATHNLVNYYCCVYDGNTYTAFSQDEGSSDDKEITVNRGDILYISITGSTITTQQIEIMKRGDVELPHIIEVGSGKKYTTLKSGIEEGLKYYGSVVYIGSGTYDLITELGSTYFQNFDNTTYPQGIALYNGIHLIFSSDAKVTCNYTGDNHYVCELFSPFNGTVYYPEIGFTIENLNIECSRVRYCVHDEMDTQLGGYQHKYINCNMKLDNSGNEYWGSRYEIGGGLGQNGEILVESCIFDNGGVSYHNSGNANAVSKLVIKDNYFISGTFRFTYYGTSTKKTRALVCGNSFYDNIITGPETPSSTTNNIDLVAWNNIVR